MTLKTLNSGSDGNCHILTSDSGKHLILDAGIPIKEIKKGLEFDIENVQACVATHGHQDHIKAADDLKNMGILVWKPYLSGIKRMQTSIGEFDIECFDVPHGCENRAFIIQVDRTTILYATDYEFIPYNLSRKNIDVAIVELNYQSDRITDMDDHRKHTVLHHAEEKTVVEFLKTIREKLRVVILCHMSKSGALDRDLAMKHVKEVLPYYTEVYWASKNKTYDLNKIPF